MASTWRNAFRLLHPEETPRPGTILYNAVSSTGLFRLHSELVANDAARYCRQAQALDVGTGSVWLPLALRQTPLEVRITGMERD